MPSADEEMLDRDRKEQQRSGEGGEQSEDQLSTNAMDDDDSQNADDVTTDSDKPMKITSDEVNFLVYRYLQESGLVHSAYTFAHESLLSRANMSRLGKDVPPGALISFLQKGLQYLGIEETLHNKGKTPSTSSDAANFSLLSPMAVGAMNSNNAVDIRLSHARLKYAISEQTKSANNSSVSSNITQSNNSVVVNIGEGSRGKPGTKRSRTASPATSTIHNSTSDTAAAATISFQQQQEQFPLSSSLPAASSSSLDVVPTSNKKVNVGDISEVVGVQNVGSTSVINSSSVLPHHKIIDSNNNHKKSTQPSPQDYHPKQSQNNDNNKIGNGCGIDSQMAAAKAMIGMGLTPSANSSFHAVLRGAQKATAVDSMNAAAHMVSNVPSSTPTSVMMKNKAQDGQRMLYSSSQVVGKSNISSMPEDAVMTDDSQSQEIEVGEKQSDKKNGLKNSQSTTTTSILTNGGGPQHLRTVNNQNSFSASPPNPSFSNHLPMHVEASRILMSHPTVSDSPAVVNTKSNSNLNGLPGTNAKHPSTLSSAREEYHPTPNNSLSSSTMKSQTKPQAIESHESLLSPGINNNDGTSSSNDAAMTNENNNISSSTNSDAAKVSAEDFRTNAPISSILDLEMHTSEVFMCAWNPVYHNWIATGSGDATARIWEMAGDSAKDGYTRSVLLEHGQVGQPNKDVTTLEWSSSGDLLATGSYDGVARVWKRSGELIHLLTCHRGPIFSLKWNKSGNFLLSGSYDKTTIVWEVTSEKGLVRQQFSFHQAPALDVDWKDDNTFASCSTDQCVHICQVGKQEPIKTYRGHKDEVNAVKWDPSGMLLASCSDDCTAKVWNVADDSVLTPLHDFQSHQQEIYTVKWSPTGKGSKNPSKLLMLATASFDGSVRLWNIETGECIRLLSRHHESVYSVAFSPSGDFIASGSLAGQLYIWNVKEGKTIKSYKGNGDIFEVAWNSGESRVAACFSSNVVSVIDFHRVQMPGRK